MSPPGNIIQHIACTLIWVPQLVERVMDLKMNVSHGRIARATGDPKVFAFAHRVSDFLFCDRAVLEMQVPGTRTIGVHDDEPIYRIWTLHTIVVEIAVAF